MTELYLKKQLEIDKALAKPNQSSVGDTQKSILTEAQFQAERDSTWVLLDGRDITNSDLAVLTGNNTLPDARGIFLRGKNNGRADGNENPSGELAVGTFEGDSMLDHQHQGTNNIAPSPWGQGTSSLVGKGIYGSGATGVTNLTSPASLYSTKTSPETRSKNLTVNIFVKINR